MKLRKDRMTPEEYEKYLQIGEIDYSQNWLELFTPAVISDLFTIMDSSSNNPEKYEIIREELGKDGFEPVGLGTNVYATAHPAYPGVVFKIALDPCGLADNFNDATLCDMVNSYLGEDRFTKVLARHPSGIVSVQERKVLVRSQDRISPFRASITKTLDKLADAFIIVDLSPSEFHLNYGIERNGDWCFLDASDLYPLSKLKEPLRCKMTQTNPNKPGEMVTCGGDLVYSNDYRFIRCEKCGRVYIPSDIRPKEKKGASEVNMMSDGFDFDEIAEMNDHEMGALLMKQRQHAAQFMQQNATYGAMSVPRDVRELNAVHGAPAGILEPSNVGLSDEDDEEETPVEEIKTLQPKPEVAKAEPPVRKSRLGSIGGEVKPKFQSVQKKAEVPEGVPVPVNKSAFTSIKPQPLEAKPIEDDEEEVEIPKTVNPTQLQVSDAATHFDPKPVEVEDDDDEEDDGIHVVNTPGLPLKPATIDFEPMMEYEFVRDATMEGILIKVQGDFEEAYDGCALPIYVSVDNGSTIELACRTSDLLPMIRSAVKRNREDIELTRKAMLGQTDEEDDGDEEPFVPEREREPQRMSKKDKKRQRQREMERDRDYYRSR